ncbi:MAG TPA: hypothetical protein PLD46_09115, partial [Hyphomicrobium sp.]|nr:hypothetical protein [Hyphomicrobium sp.]
VDAVIGQGWCRRARQGDEDHDLKCRSLHLAGLSCMCRSWESAILEWQLPDVSDDADRNPLPVLHAS